MQLRSFLAVLCLLPAPSLAGVSEAVQHHALPAAETLSAAMDDLDAAARADCRAEALRPAYHAAFDAWMGFAHLRLGPIEEEGRVLALSFWPDKKGMVQRSLTAMIAAQDPVVDSDEFHQVSIALRGFFALERLLFDPAFMGYGSGSYECRLAQAITHDMAGMARATALEWPAFGAALTDAGKDQDGPFLTAQEAAQALYTALQSGLEWNAEQRIGRPLGSFERPRPRRAEAWRSDRPLRNVTLSLEALRDLARTLSEDEIPATEAAFADALSTAAELDDPAFAGVAEPMGRLRVEILGQRIAAVRDAVAAEIGVQLGVSAGFNSADGD